MSKRENIDVRSSAWVLFVPLVIVALLMIAVFIKSYLWLFDIVNQQFANHLNGQLALVATMW